MKRLNFEKCFEAKFTICFISPIDITVPSQSEQLTKILEVMQHFLIASHYGYHHEYEVNVPKLFQSLKNSHSLLTREELCSLNIKIVDIIAAQGEEAIMLWNKVSFKILLVMFFFL